ncbi:hypothetical protein F4804DRAFT_350763 [Jackrogersella minutella]|nr:hypothetical protein F4804DRAFT_350763 [Jackrogersella minutella]
MASTQSSPAPGVTVETRFDFSSALDFLKAQLDENFLAKEWRATVTEAFYKCRDEDQSHDEKPSVIWFGVKFLDTLWVLLFGKTSQSPWKSMLVTLSSTKPNCKEDNRLDISSLTQMIKIRPAHVETAIREILRGYFPIVVSHSR